MTLPIRPLITATARTNMLSEQEGNALALPSGTPTTDFDPTRSPRVLTGEIDDQDLPDLPVISFDDDGVRTESDPMARLRRLIDERQAETVEILRGWMETDEEEHV